MGKPMTLATGTGIVAKANGLANGPNHRGTKPFPPVSAGITGSLGRWRRRVIKESISIIITSLLDTTRLRQIPKII